MIPRTSESIQQWLRERLNAISGVRMTLVKRVASRSKSLEKIGLPTNKYAELLQPFRKCTNEEDVIGEFVREVALENNVASILDIGAGFGGIIKFLPVSRSCIDAIEPESKFLNSLVNEGVNVFPIKIEDFSSAKNYDLILAVHILEAIKVHNRPKLFTKVRSLLSGNGHFILVHNSSESRINFVLGAAFNQSRRIESRLRGVRESLKANQLEFSEIKLSTESKFSNFSQFNDFVRFYFQAKPATLTKHSKRIEGFYQELPIVNNYRILDGELTAFLASNKH